MFARYAVHLPVGFVIAVLSPAVVWASVTLPFTVIPDTFPQPSSVTATITGEILIGSDSDSSALSGEGQLELGIPAAPFDTARLTELSVVLDDGADFSFLLGLLTASAKPGQTRVTLLEPGTAGPVVNGRFDQLGNLFRFEGLVDLSTEPDPLDLSTLEPVMADLIGIQLTDSGSQIETNLAFALQFKTTVTAGILPVEIPITIDVAGGIHGAAVKPIPGDLDGNQILDAADIDLLSQAVRSGSSDPRYDLNQDGQVNQQDRRVWVEQLRYTYFGDANLDGVFDSGDFVHTFQQGLYEDAIAGNAGWDAGDWNGNADFESGDFVSAFQAGGYEQGARPSSVAVPEPASMRLALLALAWTLRRRRARA